MAWNELKKIQLTIDSSKVTASLTDFPVSVYISASSGLTSLDVSTVFTELGTNDRKIAVYTDPGQSGGTECYTEVEFWDNSFNKALLHVRVPTVASGTDTALWLYYDNSQPDNTTHVGYPGDSVSQNVWDSDFEAVFHLANDPSGGAGSIKDSTSNNRDGTPTAMDATNLKDGDIGKATDFDGSAEHIAFAALGGHFSAWMITAKFKTDIVDQQQTVATQDRSGWNDDVLFGIEPEAGFGTNNAIQCMVQNDTGDVREIASDSVPVTTIDWYVASARSNGSTLYLYVDGSEVDTDGGTAIGMGNDSWYIGNSTNATRRFNGLIEEVRISSAARSEAWAFAEYYSLSDDLITYNIPAPPETVNFSGGIRMSNVIIK